MTARARVCAGFRRNSDRRRSFFLAVGEPPVSDRVTESVGAVLGVQLEADKTVEELIWEQQIDQQAKRVPREEEGVRRYGINPPGQSRLYCH